jgi:hypothetical protein
MNSIFDLLLAAGTVITIVSVVWTLVGEEVEEPKNHTMDTSPTIPWSIRFLLAGLLMVLVGWMF